MSFSTVGNVGNAAADVLDFSETGPVTGSDRHASSGVPAALLRRIDWKLLPLLSCMFIASYVNRSSIASIKAPLSADLHLSTGEYGLVAAMFTVSYSLAEMFSNKLFVALGARVSFTRIGVLWGIISSLMCIVPNLGMLLIFRIVLGIAEAGLFPGVLLYFTYWYPSRVRGQRIAIFYSAQPFSAVIAAPLSFGILKSLSHDSDLGLAGWRWLLLLEGLPAIVLGLVAWRIIADSPNEVEWLTAEEKEALTRAIRADENGTRRASFAVLSSAVAPMASESLSSDGGGPAVDQFANNNERELNPSPATMEIVESYRTSSDTGCFSRVHKAALELFHSLKGLRVWCLIIGNFASNITIGALLYFLPSLVCAIFSWDAKNQNQYNDAVLISGIPYIFAVSFLIWCCRHSDRSGDRFFHVMFPCALAGICLILLAAIDTSLPRPAALVFMTLVIPFVYCAKPVLYVWATEALAENKVMGLSSMSAFGVLGQTFGPILMGFSFDTYKSYSVGLLVLGLCEFAVAAAMVALQVELVGMAETFRSIRRLVLTCNCSEPPAVEGASDGVEFGTSVSDERAIPYESMSQIEMQRQ